MQFGLNADDRIYELTRKLGGDQVQIALKALGGVRCPTDQVLGAIVFLLRSGCPHDLDDLVDIANEDPASLLRAAVVKDERGQKETLSR